MTRNYSASIYACRGENERVTICLISLLGYLVYSIGACDSYGGNLRELFVTARGHQDIREVLCIPEVVWRWRSNDLSQ